MEVWWDLTVIPTPHQRHLTRKFSSFVCLWVVSTSCFPTNVSLKTFLQIASHFQLDDTSPLFVAGIHKLCEYYLIRYAKVALGTPFHSSLLLLQLKFGVKIDLYLFVCL